MRTAFFAVYVAVATSMLVWPLYPAFAGDTETRVLGVPLSLAWHVGWVLATFAALVAFEVTRPEPADGSDP